MVTSRKPHLDILHGLEEQAKSGKLCDVLFYNDNGSVWAHSSVLAAFSQFFSQLFALNLEKSYYWSLKQPMQINVKFITKCKPGSKNDCIDCMSQIVNFMYTGRMNTSLTHLDHLVLFSERLKNQELIEACEKYRQDQSMVKLDLSLQGSINEQLVAPEDPKKALAMSDMKLDKSRSLSSSIVPDSSQKELSIVSGPPAPRQPFSLNECKVCCYISDDPNLMKIHPKLFHSNSYRCLGCNFSHKNVTLLIEHIEENCKKQLTMCSVCLATLKTPAETLSHIKIHLSPKPFPCLQCKKSFERRSLWLKHVKSHIVRKKFKCTDCELTFNTESDCSKHIKVAHAPKKFVCQQCAFAAPFAYILEKHAMKHRRQTLTCSYSGCNFQTSSEIMLVRHRSKHKPEKVKKEGQSNVCPLCQVTFSLHKNLVRHMKIHEVKKDMFKCKFCDYETLRSDKYNEHYTNKHINDHSVSQNLAVKSQSQSNHDSAIPTKPQTENPISFSQEHNTLMMNDKGDISIVHSNEKNSVTLRNIGNLTGSITLDERTGVLTMNNINSGSVFLNEITGELTYINLENDKNRELNYFESIKPVDAFKTAQVANNSSEVTKLDEFTGEIVKVKPSTNEDNLTPDQDFDTFDMDINDDSFDGFDDFDELLFDVFEGNETDLGVVIKNDKSLEQLMPHLDESTGLLTFDDKLVSQSGEVWSHSYSQLESCPKDNKAHVLLLDEVTGVLHD